jgi:hypothetical protein
MQVISFALLMMFFQRADAAPPPPRLFVNDQLRSSLHRMKPRSGLESCVRPPLRRPAQDQASVVGKEILAAITKVGVPANQIQTARLVLTPMYGAPSPEARDAPVS